MGAGGIPANNASSGNIAGLPPDQSSCKKKEKIHLWWSWIKKNVVS